MAIKAINNTTGPDGLVPTLLVYRAYPKISNLDPPAPSITEQTAAIQKAITEIVKLQAKQTVNSTLHHHNRPDTTSVYNLLLNSEVLIWHKSGNWTRPYCLLAIENAICCVQLPSRPTNFRNTSIKPYFQSKNTYNVEPDEPEAPTKPDKLKAPTEPDEPETPLPTLKVPQKPTKPTEPAIKCSQRRP